VIRELFPWIGGAALAGCAVFFAEPWRLYLLLALMLFFPLLDRHWRLPAIPTTHRHRLTWAALGLAMVLLVAIHPTSFDTAAAALMIAALPEEWFFRAYFMARLDDHRWMRGLRANLAASLVFAFIHGLSRDWTTAFLVFTPSLFYGWLYQRTRDLPMLVLAHALSNLMFSLFLTTPLDSMLHSHP
jgi:membrane protease YdiL (CAAX protease family)